MRLLPTEPRVFALGLWLIAGCESAVLDSPKPASDDGLFAPTSILNVAIEIAPPELETLKQNKESHSYVRCTFRARGETVANAGIHCRGKPAKELATGKPDLIVTFDKFVSGQKFQGQKRLVLQASREDPSYLGAPIAFEMFRAVNVPAPRCGFARVELNGRDHGLYLLIEGVEREFLERHFRRTNGNLYDEGHPPDVTGKLEKASGRDRNDQSDADALAAAALQTDPAERWKQLQQRLDMGRFLAFIALEVLLWQDDSYSIEARKFRLYHDPETDRMVFFPKAVERVLQKTDGPILPECKGVVARAVLTAPEGERAYRQTVARLLTTVFEPAKVQARARELATAIRGAVADNNPGAAKDFDSAVARFCDAVVQRSDFVAKQLKAQSRD